MCITNNLIEDIEKQKDIIMDALSQMENLLRTSKDYMAQERFRSYVKGAVEQAMTQSGFHNICVDSIVKNLKEELDCED